jgi:LPXTG-site transpeptidase (sortase) family protein
MFDVPGRERTPLTKLFVAAVPLILSSAFLGGGAAFLMGNVITDAMNAPSRHTLLPIAADRALPASPTASAAVRAPRMPVVSTVSAPTRPLAPVPTSVAGDWVRIPALEVAVPLSPAKSMVDADVLAALSSGVALYPNGITPGAPGRVFIAGHSTGEPWKGPHRFAFRRLNELTPGDTVLIDFHGTRYTYRITEHSTIDPRTIPTLASAGHTPTVTLMACWPLWTTKNRLLVDAELVAVNPLTIPAQQRVSRGNPSVVQSV